MFISNQSYPTPTHTANAAATEEFQSSVSRQDNAGQVPDSEQDKVAKDKVFLSEALEHILANRLGVDKEKLDELKDKIEELEKLENPTDEQKKQLEMLTTQLEELVREAAKRTMEKMDSTGKDETSQKLLAYQQVASLSKPRQWP